MVGSFHQNNSFEHTLWSLSIVENGESDVVSYERHIDFESSVLERPSVDILGLVSFLYIVLIVHVSGMPRTFLIH